MVKNARANNTNAPVTAPPKGVFTPLELLMEVRVNEPVMGIEETKLLRILQRPKATISCEASTIFPLAKQIRKNTINKVLTIKRAKELTKCLRYSYTFQNGNKGN